MITQLRLLIGALTVLGAAGWIAAGYQASRPCPDVQPQVIVREVNRDYSVPVETPVIDALMDEGWEAEMDRQSDCLYQFIREHVLNDITLEVVFAAGYWTDALGGACLVIGEDSE